MKDKIKRGDVVRLKSGGPRMTVEQTDPQSIECVWFTHDLADCASTESFHPDMLVKVDPAAGAAEERSEDDAAEGLESPDPDGEEHRRESIRRARIEGAEKAIEFMASGTIADTLAAASAWADRAAKDGAS